MSIETPELRGRIINSAIHLEDEMDRLFLAFIMPQFSMTKHQLSVYEILNKQLIEGKTFGRKAELIKDVFRSEVFKDKYYESLLEFIKLNGLGLEFNDYKEFYKLVTDKLEDINKTRNIVAHCKVTYDIFMSIDEINSEREDRKFFYKGKKKEISISDEEGYNKDISYLSALFKFIRMVIISENYSIE